MTASLALTVVSDMTEEAVLMTEDRGSAGSCWVHWEEVVLSVRGDRAISSVRTSLVTSL